MSDENNRNLKKAIALVIEAISLITEGLNEQQREKEEGLAAATKLVDECLDILNEEEK